MPAEQKQLAIPDWVLLGDYSRRVFLQWLTGSAHVLDLEGLPVWVRYAETLSFRRSGEAWLVGTPRTIPGTVLFIPLPDTDWHEYHLRKSTRFALFEEFPYGKQSNGMILQDLRQDYEANSVLIVLMDIPHRQGSTDLVPQGGELQIQYEKYRAKENVCIARGDGDVLRILHWEEYSENLWRRQIRADLDRLGESVEDSKYDYEILYMDFLESILSEHVINKICSFQSVQRSRQNSIWNGYTKAAMLQMFPASGSGGLYPVAELYRDIISAFSPNLWDLEQDCRGLVDAMKKSLEKELSAPELLSVTFCSHTEDAYLSIVNEYKINVNFRKRLEHYVNITVSNILKDRLELRYNQLREALS